MQQTPQNANHKSDQGFVCSCFQISVGFIWNRLSFYTSRFACIQYLFVSISQKLSAARYLDEYARNLTIENIWAIQIPLQTSNINQEMSFGLDRFYNLIHCLTFDIEWKCGVMLVGAATTFPWHLINEFSLGNLHNISHTSYFGYDTCIHYLSIESNRLRHINAFRAIKEVSERSRK